jgi:BlaI family penicillinase repressor
MKIQKPTDAELEILQVMWVHGPSSVRFINDQLNQKREIGYTTTLKLMQIMLEKGLLRRDTENRSHIYEVTVSEEVTQQLLLEEFVENTFRGSAMKLVMQALGNHSTSDSELEAIKSLIQQLENDQQS